MDTHKILVETTAEIEVGYSSDRSRSRERSPSPRWYSNRQYGNSRLGSRSRSRPNPRVTTNKDRIRCYK